METQSQPGSLWERSTARRLFLWLFSWRAVGCLLFAVTLLVTLIALFYAEENWRGYRAWTKHRQALKARGEQLELSAFIPKPVPDEQNFAATPFVQSWFPRSSQWQDNYSQVAGKILDAKPRKNRSERRFLDLVAWGAAFDAVRAGKLGAHERFDSEEPNSALRTKAAPTVLEGLKDSEVIFAELRMASQRPYSRYPLNYDLENPWGILLPHLVNIKGTVQRLQLKACAELAAGQNQNALADVSLMFYMADSIKGETFLITYLVRLACEQMAIQPIWEGLAEHRWTESQLQTLQSRLQQYDFLTDLKPALDCERAAGILTADLLYRNKYRPSDLFDQSSGAPGGDCVNLIGRIIPHGWYYQEQLSYCRLYENQLQGAYDAAKRRVWPSQIAANAHEFEREVAGGRLGKNVKALLHHQVLAAMLLPALNKLPIRAATAQTITDHAALACALERYRLANGQFPEKLEALTPRFLSPLPHDLFTGEPYKYRRTDDGQFTLSSVGWDEKDDAGAAGKLLPAEVRATGSDWVWRYPDK